MKNSNCESYYVKYYSKIRALPIGGLICLRSAPMFSDKIIALKQSNTMFSIISYGVINLNIPISYVAAECAHSLSMLNRYVHLHITTDAHNMYTSIILDYTSYSQIDWRYIRNLLGKAAVYPIVMHSDMYDTLVRHLPVLDLSGFKSTFLMFLHYGAYNISINSVRSNMFILLELIMRSRSVYNLYTIDILQALTNIYANSIEYVEPLSELDDDEEYKAAALSIAAHNLAMEQQFSVAGMLMQRNVYSLSNVFVVLNVRYLNVYTQLCIFLHESLVSMLRCVASFIHYVWLCVPLDVYLGYKLNAFCRAQLHCVYY